MRAAALLLSALLPLAAAFAPIVIDIEFDQLELPDELDHGSGATPVTSRTPFPASSAPALREEDELKIDWTGEGDKFDPVAFLDAQEAGLQETSDAPPPREHFGSEAMRIAPGGMVAAAFGAAMPML